MSADPGVLGAGFCDLKRRDGEARARLTKCRLSTSRESLFRSFLGANWGLEKCPEDSSAHARHARVPATCLQLSTDGTTALPLQKVSQCESVLPCTSGSVRHQQLP